MPAPPTNDDVRTARAALAAADDDGGGGARSGAAGHDRASVLPAPAAEDRVETAAEQELEEAQRALNRTCARPCRTGAPTLQETAQPTAWFFDGVTIDADVARLHPFVPIIFFPVRVETRFDWTTSSRAS